MRPPRRSCLLFLLLLFALSVLAYAQSVPADAQPSVGEQVSETHLFRESINIPGPQGAGVLLIASDSDVHRTHLGVSRALVVFPGTDRNAIQCLKSFLAARIQAGLSPDNTLVLAVQFLNEQDTHVAALPARLLYWRGNNWEAGWNSLSPIGVSSYAALDEVLKYLSNAWFFPNMHEVVIAGYGGGGQLVQRYAAVGHAVPGFEKSGIALRFVVSNAASYLYFDDERPVPSVVANCENFNTWGYGLRVAPPYVGAPAAKDVEAAFVARNVTYLIDMDDADPSSPNLGTNCGGKAEGGSRFDRAIQYFQHLQTRHGTGLNQRLVLAHAGSSAGKLYSSPCGLEALFGIAGCKPETLPGEALPGNSLEAPVAQNPGGGGVPPAEQPPAGQARP